LQLNQTKPLGDEIATLCEISIELPLLFFTPGRKVNKVKIYSVLNLNVHPYQIFITFSFLNNREELNSKRVCWEQRALVTGKREKQ
jgi:hypothetical protein